MSNISTHPGERTTEQNEPALPGGWFMFGVVRQLWQRFWASCREIPRHAWLVWWRVLAIGAVLNVLVVVGVTFGARALVENGGLQAWDEQTLRAIGQGPVSFHTGIIWQAPGSLPYLIPLVWLFIAWMIWRRQPLPALAMAAIYYLGHPFIFLGWFLWDRQRPDFVAGGIAAPPLHSFPSGHVAITVSIYGLLAYLWARRSQSWLERALIVVLWLAWVGVVGISRLATGVHWPSDVIAGFVIGLAWLAVVVVGLRRAEAASRV